jgi:hypothetical protein
MALAEMLEAEADAAVLAGGDSLDFVSQFEVVDVADHRFLPPGSQ